MRQTLLEGYSFSWLGMLAAGMSGSGGVDNGRNAAWLQPSQPLQPIGSRLPVPAEWLLWEAAGVDNTPSCMRDLMATAMPATIFVHTVCRVLTGAPSQHQQGSGGGSGAKQMTTQAALCLALALSQAAAPSFSSIPAGLRLQSSMMLVFGPSTAVGSTAGLIPEVCSTSVDFHRRCL
jgi:hypothetical protein